MAAKNSKVSMELLDDDEAIEATEVKDVMTDVDVEGDSDGMDLGIGDDDDDGDSLELAIDDDVMDMFPDTDGDSLESEDEAPLELSHDTPDELDVLGDDDSAAVADVSEPALEPVRAKGKGKSKTKSKEIDLGDDIELGTEFVADDDENILDCVVDINDSVEYLAWLIYGKNGVGKTTLLGTDRGVLVFAAEDGTKSIRDAKGSKKIRVDKWEKVEKMYWALNSSYEKHGLVDGGIKLTLKDGDFIVRYVAFDTITRLAEVCMRAVVKEGDKDVVVRALKDWGNSNDKLKFWLQKFRDLPLQSIWLCQEDANTDDTNDEEFSITPAANKGLKVYLQSEADVIARMYHRKTDDGVEVRLSAVPNGTFIARDRTKTLTKSIKNPDLKKMYAAMFEGK